MDELVRNLRAKKVLRTPSIIKAFRAVDRKDFVPEEFKNSAYADTALPIGWGQTISQPLTVAFMFELLEPKRGEVIMDVGHGSGWTTALLAHIIGPASAGGKVFAFEIVPELCRFGKENFLKYPKFAKRAEFFCRDASLGLPDMKFDGIIAAAEVQEVPEAWRSQLKTGGRLVYPKENAIMKEIKEAGGAYNVETYPGFVFVPYISNAGK